MATSTLFLLLSLILPPIAVRAQQRINSTNIVLLGSSLSPINGTNSNSSWLSPSAQFAFGFYPQSSDAFAVAVWFAKIREKTVTWYFTYDNENQKQAVVVSSNATLTLTNDGSLILQDGKGRDYDIFGGGDASSAAMLDSGNFVLYNSTSQIMRQTFDSPTNTILQGQRLLPGAQLFSGSIASQNFKGRFRIKMQRDGNLVQYPIQTPDAYPYAYWEVREAVEFPGVTLNLDDSGNLFLRNGSGANILKNITDGWNFPSTKTVQFYRATLDADGIFRVYSHASDQEGNWSVRWSTTNDGCDPKGLCGLNAYCALTNQAADCRCIPQFDFVNQADKTSDCVRIRRISYDCRNGTNNEEVTALTMAPIEGISWRLDDSYFTLPSTTEADCKSDCLNDCDCEAVRFLPNNECRKHRLPLKYGKRERVIN